jgi:hypothetical protein
MSEGGIDIGNIFQKTGNWLASKMVPGGLPTISETNSQLFPDISPEDPKPPIEERLKIPEKNVARPGWLDTLPIAKLRGGSLGDIVDTGENLERYASHWDGKWDSESSTLTLNPTLNSRILESGGQFIDTELATIEGEPIQNDLWKVLTADKYGNIILNENDIPSQRDGNPLMFRGINHDGMKAAFVGGLSSGPIMKARGLGERVYFGRSAQRAIGYAARGQGRVEMATFNHPSYMIVVKAEGNIQHDQLGDPFIKAPMSLDAIHQIYEVRPYSITPGKLHLTERQMSLENPSQPLDEPFMELPDAMTQVKNAPQGKFVYREISLDEVMSNIQ